jgi:hypothetical protein
MRRIPIRTQIVYGLWFGATIVLLGLCLIALYWDLTRGVWRGLFQL